MSLEVDILRSADNRSPPLVELAISDPTTRYCLVADMSHCHRLDPHNKEALPARYE